jgi:very-short-patch-repair endonuclease
MVAVYAGGALAAGWGRSAAAVVGLIDAHPKIPEIVVPYRRYARIDGAVVHRSSALCSDHIMLWHNMPITKPLITAVDLGVVLSPMDLAEVYVRARQMRLFEPDAVKATITRLARSGRTGIRTAREATELVMIGDRPADSVLELRFHHNVGRYLPEYEYQWNVRVNGRDLRIDFAYPSIKLAIELDGYDKRKSRASLDYDARRGRSLLHDGWKVAHFTWTDVTTDPHGVAAEILELLRVAGYRFCS